MSVNPSARGEHYDSLVDAYDRLWCPRWAESQERLTETMQLARGERLLDLACGNGVVTHNPHRAAVVYQPRSTVIVNPPSQADAAVLRSAAGRLRPGGTIIYSVCTINADENEAVVDASGLRAEPLGEEWPQFAHPRRPEFLLTLPYVNGTSGFFIARLTQ